MSDVDRLAHARESALGSYGEIARLMSLSAASDDNGAFEDMAQELAEAAGYEVIGGGNNWGWRSVKNGAPDDQDIRESEEEAWIACCEDNDLRPDRDDIKREIQEMPLSVEVRSGWYLAGGEPDCAEEFRIVLTTGGPAVQIRGDLDSHGEPTRAYLQCQDWGTSWTDVFDVVDSEVLLEFARQFYYGE